MRPVAWESWCSSVWWVGEGPFWTTADGRRWLVCWLLLSRLLGNRCDRHNCETRSTVDSSLTVCSETSLWKESKTLRAHPAQQQENLLIITVRRPGALSSLVLAFASFVVKLHDSNKREIGRGNDKIGFGSSKTTWALQIWQQDRTAQSLLGGGTGRGEEEHCAAGVGDADRRASHLILHFTLQTD